MLDSGLAALYGVETRVLVQAVRRNPERFPDDFMFRLSKDEFDDLRSQTVTSSWGGRRYPPYAFTQEGVAMLSSVLRSKRAALVNISIMRTFVRLREALATNEELSRKVAQHDEEIEVLFEYVQRLLQPPGAASTKRIGFE